MQPKLTCELVPASSWCRNVREAVTQTDWNLIRRAQYAIADYLCEICQGRGNAHPVECHEIWEYNDNLCIQRLKGFQALCPSCHKVKHLGLQLTKSIYGFKASLNHLLEINNWTIEDTEAYVIQQFEIHKDRSQHEWSVDLSYLSTLDPPVKIREDLKEKSGTYIYEARE